MWPVPHQGVTEKTFVKGTVELPPTAMSKTAVSTVQPFFAAFQYFSSGRRSCHPNRADTEPLTSAHQNHLLDASFMGSATDDARVCPILRAFTAHRMGCAPRRKGTKIGGIVGGIAGFGSTKYLKIIVLCWILQSLLRYHTV